MKMHLKDPRGKYSCRETCHSVYIQWPRLQDKYMALTVHWIAGVTFLWFARSFNVECDV